MYIKTRVFIFQAYEQVLFYYFGSIATHGPAHSRMFHLSLAIYTVTIIVFEAKARYVHWTSESTHYGHQLNAPRGTSSVASHYLTTIGPTCRRVSTLHSYKK